jgi:uncharacterized repeat protein (TIGR01451 family)
MPDLRAPPRMSLGRWTCAAVRRPPGVRRGATSLPRFGLLFGLGLLVGLFALTASGAEGDTVTTALPKVVPDEFSGDLSKLPRAPLGQAQIRERPYRPLLLPPGPTKAEVVEAAPEKEARTGIAIKAAMPSPAQNFEGIARTDTCVGGQCGAGTPPDTNGEVGPNHYIQAVNSAYGIYNKIGTLLASFTEDQLWSGNGTICNGQSQGDPVVIYDALADRWILTHFAFGFAGPNPVAPYYECIAVSKTADPVAGGWWLYPVRMDDVSHPWLNDYSKFGIWTDCLYMSANEFTGVGSFQGTLFASFSRADMYAGAALTSSVGYITNTTDPFTMIPSHLGGQSGAAVPASTPNYFVSESQTVFAWEVRKFVAGPNCGAGGTLGAATNVSQTSYTFPNQNIVPQPGTAILLDSLDDRLMQKVHYRKIGAQESLWVAHTFRTSSSGATGIQWAQIDVTGGTISTTPVQQQKYAPADALYRWMPSLAVDRQGNMAVGYSTSNGAAPNYPSIAYSGRLASDTANTLPQTETLLIAGGSSQTGNCGGAPCHRWGDYSAMSTDPDDDCTFWVTNEYYPGPPSANTIAWHTRIGSFKFPGCTASSRTADLAITKTDGSLTVAPGALITYTIVVTNNGPFAVTGANVTDTLPASITGATWTCTASGGSSCPASGSASINTSTVNLLAGGTATFTLTGTVAPLATGTLSNTATVSAPSGITDPNTANNSATDIDTVTAPSSNANLANLVLSAGTLTPAFASSTLSYSATVVSSSNTITVTPTVADASATVTVNGVAVASGTASGPITLSPGSNPITVVVTAQDGVTTKTYMVNVSYVPSSSCTYSLSPIDLSNTAPAGGSANITVTTPAGCPVTATSFQPWVTVNSITPNGGTTTVALQISANAGVARATSIVVADRLFLITQLGP